MIGCRAMEKRRFEWKSVRIFALFRGCETSSHAVPSRRANLAILSPYCTIPLQAGQRAIQLLFLASACKLRVTAIKAPGLGQPAAMSDVESSSESSSSSNEAKGPEYAEACGSSSSGEEPASPKRRGRVALFTWSCARAKLN